MNKLKCANYRDETRLDILNSRSDKMSKITELAGDIINIKAAYQLYKTNRGNPYKILDKLSTVPISDEMGEVLSYYYEHPVLPIKFIKKLRTEHRFRCCPMCGSFSCGTIDHYLPQAPHNIFAIFSLNLIPTCLCNSKKSNRLTGKNVNERFLHPYFDNCLQQRLIKVDFHHLDSAPTVSSRVILPASDPDFTTVNYHFEKLVQENLEEYTLQRFIDFCRRPAVYITPLRENPKSIGHLRNILEWELQAKDEEYDSKNNWNSLFVDALLEDPVFTWLANKFFARGRLPGMPLIPL